MCLLYQNFQLKKLFMIPITIIAMVIIVIIFPTLILQASGELSTMSRHLFQDTANTKQEKVLKT